MNLNNIGEYICKKRKLKKLTQKELALKMNVSEKAISKWETGKGLPEISNMKLLCEILDISLIDLLNGDDKKDEEKYIEYVEHENKKKNQIIRRMIISFIVLLFILLLVFFVGNYNKIAIYELYGESEHFTYNNGLLMKSNIKNLLISGEIEIKDGYIAKDDIKAMTLYAGDEKVIGARNMEFHNYYLEDYGYDEILSDKKIKNLNKWFIKIEYMKNNVTMIEEIAIKNNLMMKNNKLFPFRADSITNDENDNEKDSDKTNKLVEFLKKNNYEKIDDMTYKKDNIEIIVRNNSEYLSDFVYKDEKYFIRFNPYTGSYTFVDKNDDIVYSYYKNSNHYYCNNELCNNPPKDIIKYYEKIDEEFEEFYVN